MNKKINPENKCSQLYKKIKPKNNTLKEIWNRQVKFQKRCGCLNDNITFKERLRQIDMHWRNLCVEFGEFMDRLPYKEWKKYDEDIKNGKMTKEQRLELEFEFIDMACFFFNIGIYLGITWDKFYSLYIVKNQENFNRQKRNY